MNLTSKMISKMISLSLSVTLLIGISFHVNSNSIKVKAESTAQTSAIAVLETDVETASEDCTMLGIYGSFYSQAQQALDRINEIRKEACDAGNVPHPKDPSRMLTSSDYVPIKWSKDLESIARIRAVEGGLAYSFLSSGHSRLNGQSIWSVQYNGIKSSAENLAYNWGTSMVSGINQWYQEKSDWINQTSGAVTGHYTSIINPSYTYVGLGDFYTEAAGYPNTLAGQFCSSSKDLDQSMQTAQTDVMQKIEVKNSYIEGYILEGDDTINIGDTTELTLRVNLVNNSKTLELWSIESIAYTSSNPSVAQVTDTGVVTGQSAGTVTITVTSGGQKLADLLITVKTPSSSDASSTTAKVTDKNSKAVYRVTGTEKNKTVEYVKSTQKKITNVTIPASIQIDGSTYKVTSIKQGALKNSSKLKSVEIGKNITVIGVKAFSGCKKLRNITVKTNKLTAENVGKNAFSKGYSKPQVKAKKSKCKLYQSIFQSKGMSKKCEFTAL